mmetsp:Transcript_19116/g.28339  ORF Transcript_19116/g.28339 Transcript_19116/m.28339 type:complete len:102 (+) Transcript_19116:46-351(+)
MQNQLILRLKEYSLALRTVRILRKLKHVIVVLRIFGQGYGRSPPTIKAALVPYLATFIGPSFHTTNSLAKASEVFLDAAQVRISNDRCTLFLDIVASSLDD